MTQHTPRFRGALILPSGRKLSTRTVDVSAGHVRLHFHALAAPTLDEGAELSLEIQRRDLPSVPALSGRLVRTIDVMLGRVLEFEVQDRAELSRLLDPALRPMLGRSRPERRSWREQPVPGSHLRVSLPLGRFEDEPSRLWCRVVHERTEGEGVHLGLRFLEPKNRYYQGAGGAGAKPGRFGRTDGGRRLSRGRPVGLSD